MIELDDARDVVLASVPRLPAVDVPLNEALGLVTAADVVATEAVPPFDNTAVDGYAVRAADTAGAPCELDAIAFLPAGAAPSVAVGAGQAIRIMTGAPLPEGADAVVMVEDTTIGEGVKPEAPHTVRIGRAVTEGDAVRRAGDDVRIGEIVIPAGTVLRAGHLGVLASLGRSTVRVVQRARVGVLSTGDELVVGDGPLQPGQIRESNKAMLLALVAESGAEPVDLGLVRDDEAALTDVFERAAQELDAVVTSGGVSMGDVDIVKIVLDRVADMRWMQIAIKPAKPFAFGTLTGGPRPVPVFGLPGNPVSSMVSFELLARAGLREMMGQPDLLRPRVRAVADEPLRRRPDGKVHWMRVHAAFADDGRLHVRSTGAQGSHQLSASSSATGLAAVPDGNGVEPGGEVDVVWLG